MATNATRKFLSIIQDEKGVSSTLSWDRYSIYNHISLTQPSNRAPEREKMMRWSRKISKKNVNVKTCLSPSHNENVSIELKFESMIVQRMRYWAHDSVQCKKMSIINEHIPKRQVESDNKPTESVNSRKKDYLKPKGESVLDSMSDKRKPKLYSKGWSNWYSNLHWYLSTLNWKPKEGVLDPNCN